MPYHDPVSTNMRFIITSCICVDLLQRINRTYATAPTTEYTILSHNFDAEITFQTAFGLYLGL
jgi:hypothetical protein